MRDGKETRAAPAAGASLGVRRVGRAAHAAVPRHAGHAHRPASSAWGVGSEHARRKGRMAARTGVGAGAIERLLSPCRPLSQKHELTRYPASRTGCRPAAAYSWVGPAIFIKVREEVVKREGGGCGRGRSQEKQSEREKIQSHSSSLSLECAGTRPCGHRPDQHTPAPGPGSISHTGHTLQCPALSLRACGGPASWKNNQRARRRRFALALLALRATLSPWPSTWPPCLGRSRTGSTCVDERGRGRD